MRRWSTFYLALAVALVFALIGFYYLLPGVYHPLSADTVLHTTPHLTLAAIFWLLAGVSIVLGGFVRPSERG
jgi:uncharacterized protein YjeT (DUF2065 family)